MRRIRKTLSPIFQIGGKRSEKADSNKAVLSAEEQIINSKASSGGLLSQKL